MQRYGVEHPSQSEQAKEAAKKTCMQRYGVEHYASTDECKEKIEKTCLERFGAKNVWCKGAVGRKKAAQTKLARHGDANFNNREKAKQTCLAQHDVDNVSKAVEVSEKARKSLMMTFYRERLLKHPFVQPLFSAEEYSARQKETLLKWKCLKCGTEFEATCNWNFRKDYEVKSVARCPSCYPLHFSTSAEEKKLAAFIKSVYSG